MTKFTLLFKQVGKGFCTLLQVAMILLAGWMGWNFYYDIAMFLYDLGMFWRDPLTVPPSFYRNRYGNNVVR